jgi:hypothetical protein
LTSDVTSSWTARPRSPQGPATTRRAQSIACRRHGETTDQFGRRPSGPPLHFADRPCRRADRESARNDRNRGFVTEKSGLSCIHADR